MTRISPLLALVLIAACGQQDNKAAPQSNETTTEPAAPAAAAKVPSLDGNWHIAAIDGKAVAAASAMVATFSGGKASVASGCLRRAWSYTQQRNVVTFAADPAGSSNCGGGTTGDQETAYAALDQASIVIFSKDGSEANLSGTGGNLTLRRR